MISQLSKMELKKTAVNRIETELIPAFFAKPGNQRHF